MTKGRIGVVHWAVQTPRHQLELEEAWLAASGGRWVGGVGQHARLPWAGVTVELTSINTNHVVSLVDSEGALVPDRVAPDVIAWQKAVQDAQVLVALIDTGRRQPYVAGFDPYAQKARQLLCYLGRAPESLPMMFALDRRAHPDVLDEDIAFLVPMMRWPACEHVVVDRGAETVVLDRALALGRAALHGRSSSSGG